MAGYTRQSAGLIISGTIITAATHNNEFNAIQTAFDGTNGHTHDGTSGEAPPISLIASVAGILPVPNGGTGLATLTSGGVVVGAGTSASVVTAAGTADQVLVIPHTSSTIPVFGSVRLTSGAGVTGILPIANGGTGLAPTLTDGQILIGKTSDGSLTAATLTASTGITITNAGGSITLAVTGSTYQPLAAQLTTFAAYNTNGLFTQTAAGTYTGRTITSGTNITVTNGDGVSGNPTLNLSGQVAVANGGTGLATLTLNSLLVGAGTSATTFIAPSTSGNALISNGTTWASTANINTLADTTNGGLAFSGSTGAVTAKMQPSDLLTKTTPTIADSIVIMDAAASNLAKTSTIAQIKSGSIAQIVNTETGTVATGTTLMPGHTNAIPTNIQGDQYMSLQITPLNVNSILLIDIVWFGATSATGATVIQAALYQDSTANALAVGEFVSSATNAAQGIVFRHKMTAGTTSATTFKLRAGCNASGTTTFNGVGGGQVGGGVMASSITIMEILP